MIGIDWGSLVYGLGAGIAMSTLFFAGLAVGMKIALRSASPAAILLLSASVRIVILLIAVWFITSSGQNGWALIGFALGFFVIRLVTTIIAKPNAPISPNTGDGQENI
jgi:F1F0 ATPase subunit 2